MDEDHLPLGDPVWRDAFLIGGETRVTQVAIASLLEEERIRLVAGMLFVRRSDEALDPTETIQRLVLNVISLDPEATVESVAPKMLKTEPMLAIQRYLVDAGLMKSGLLGRISATSEGKKEAARLVAANASTPGTRGVAYRGLPGR